MSIQKSWRYLTVRDFFEEYDWSGQEPTPLGNALHSSTTAQTWQCQTAQAFLGRFNWTGRSVRQQALVFSPQELSTCLPVKDFFHLFVWEGQPNIAAVPEAPKPFSVNFEDDLDLDDFSNMF